LLKVNNQLAKYNSVGTLELTQAKESLMRRQRMSAMQTLVSKCTITAPFDGRVSKRHAAAWQYMTRCTGSRYCGNPGSGATYAGAVKMVTALKFRRHLPVTIDELGQTFPAKIKRTGAQIDPVSQTIPVIGVITGNAENCYPG
jgi:hypothetical protein